MNNKSFRFGVSGLLIAGIAIAVVYREQFDAVALEQWIPGACIAGPIVFMLIYAVGTVFFFPGSVLTLAGGALFGPILGTFYNLTGATLGAGLAFIVARYLASDWVEQRTGKRTKQLMDGVEAEGWRFVAFTRLVPFFPFNLLNYALGLTRIKLPHYLVASYVFMLPGAIAYTYLGYLGREAIAGQEDLIQKSLLALALLAIAAFIPRIIGRLRRGSILSVQDLREKMNSGEPILILDVRSTDEFVGEQGHITTAKNIPVETLHNRSTELADYMECPIAIVCRTDKRSAKAARILTRIGFADVHVVRGGMTQWNELGYGVEH